MDPRRFLVVIALVLALLGASLTSADARSSAQPDLGAVGESAPVADVELWSALEQSGLVDAWIDAGGVSAQVALVSVQGADTYEDARGSFLAGLSDLAARSDFLDRRAAEYDAAETRVDRLEDVVLDVRRMVVARLDDPATSATTAELYEARVALAGLVPDRRVGGFSLDSLDLIDYRLERIRDRLERDIEALGRAGAAPSKSQDPLLVRLRSVPGDLEGVRQLIELGRQSEIERRFRLAADRAEAVEAMDDLHALRRTASTSVGGLSVVTLDAYVRGAAAGESCGIDWTLLAGIGRIESFHGTIGDGRVLASGMVSQPILGPLLDGGATAAEARAAAARAAEEAARLAEEEAAAIAAEVAAAEEEAAAFNALVWGTPVDDGEDAEDAETGGGEPPDSRFDPLLWGDVPSDGAKASSDDADADEDDGDEEEDDDEPKGNGFAVIVDTDNGRLDGNARWDRAVGPMQFIPETWSRFATDGNGDGVADPQNLYDAAATAARFLCRLKQSRGPSPYDFVLGYNSSETYVRNVMAVADAFEAVTLPATID